VAIEKILVIPRQESLTRDLSQIVGGTARKRIEFLMILAMRM
jgi:hypothetical protein